MCPLTYYVIQILSFQSPHRTSGVPPIGRVACPVCIIFSLSLRHRAIVTDLSPRTRKDEQNELAGRQCRVQPTYTPASHSLNMALVFSGLSSCGTWPAWISSKRVAGSASARRRK